ncbi:MAG TPA: nucleotide disphospho-sugar-binding domain-containing protein [Mycobacterium sp.]|nr:nucleotide disphospho-sugar-binding domain-containing protein [Mycobacterium sp.]
MLGALAHGLPQLCLPQGADQFRNAQACAAAGAGIALIGADATTDRIEAGQAACHNALYRSKTWCRGGDLGISLSGLGGVVVFVDGTAEYSVASDGPVGRCGDGSPVVVGILVAWWWLWIRIRSVHSARTVRTNRSA